MRVPHVDVQEPLLRPRVSLDPVDGDWRNFIGALEPAPARVEDLIESGIPVKRRVPLTKGADRGCFQACVAQTAHPAGLADRVAEAARVTVRKRLGRNAA